MKLKRYKCVGKNDAWGQGVLILNYYFKINNFCFGILATSLLKKGEYLKRFDNYFFYGRIIKKQNIVSEFKIKSVFLKRSLNKKRYSGVILNFIAIEKIRILFCYVVLILWVIFSPFLKMFLKIKFCQKVLKKIFLFLNKFLTKSNRLCQKCSDHLDINTNIKGWFNKQCYICSWVFKKNKKGEK